MAARPAQAGSLHSPAGPKCLPAKFQQPMRSAAASLLTEPLALQELSVHPGYSNYNVLTDWYKSHRL